MRARDSDRNETCQILDGALAEGQLSLEEHRNRISAATNAATLGDLEGLISDLQATSTPANAGTPRFSPRRRLITAVVVAGVLAISIGVAVFSKSEPAPSQPVNTAPVPHSAISAAPQKPTDPGSASDDVAPSVLNVPKQLHTLGGMTGLLDQMRKRFGDTTGTELAITPNEAMLYRPDPTDDKSKLLYRFKGGWGDPTKQPRDDKDTPADLSAFDVKAVAEVLRLAPETLGIPPEDVGDVWLDIDNMADAAGPAALELLVKVEKKSGGDGFIYLDSAGHTKRVEYPS
jgi:hypothetical protein